MHEMTHCPIKASGRLVAVAASVLFATSAFANTARFYDDGLRMSAELKPFPAPRTFHLADTSRFYDDGLTRPVLMPAAGLQERVAPPVEIRGNALPQSGFPFLVWPNSLE
jgi:hypothetical protein